MASLRDASDGDVVEIEAGLLIAEKAAIEHATLVAAIGGHHRKSARQRRRVTSRLRTQRQSDAAVQPAAALKQEASVPLIGQRQSESDPVRFSIRARALVDYAVDAAERWNGDRHRSGKVGEIRSVPGAEAGMDPPW